MYLIKSENPLVWLYRLAVLLVGLLGFVSGELLIYDNNENSNVKNGLKSLHNEAVMDGGRLKDPLTKTVFEAVAGGVKDDFEKRQKRSEFPNALMDNEIKAIKFLTNEHEAGKQEKHRIRRAPCYGMFGGGGGSGGGGGNGGGTGAGGGLSGGGSISSGVGDADFDAGGIAGRRRRLARQMSRRMSRKTKARKFTSDNNNNVAELPANRRKRQTEESDLNSETNQTSKTFADYYRQFGEKMHSTWKGFMDKVNDLTSSMANKFNSN